MVATAGGLHLDGNRVYCGVGWSGFYMLDARNPTNPVVLARHRTEGQVFDLWARGQYAFVAEGWEGLAIVDVSEPARSVCVGKLGTWGEARAVEVAGSCIYLAEGGGGLSVFGLPSSPVVILEHPASVRVAAGTQASLSVKAFGAGPLSYQWYQGQTGDTSWPVTGATERCFTTPPVAETSAYWVRVSNSTGTRDSRAAVVSPVPPASVELLSLWPGYRRGSAGRVRLENNLVYAATGGMQIWDVAIATSPRLLGVYDPKGRWVSDLWKSGGVVYLACSEGGVEVIDVSRPEAPCKVGSCTNRASLVKVAGDRLFAWGEGTLWALDITDPMRPREIGACNTSWASRMAVGDGFAYLAAYERLEVVYVGGPGEMRPVGACTMRGYAQDVDVVGRYAYVAEQPRWQNDVRVGGGLVVVDVTDAENPRPVFVVGTQGYPAGVCVENGCAWLADGDQGLAAIQVTNPLAPREIGRLRGFYANSAAVCGSRACVGAGTEGMKVLDVSSPAAPRLLGEAETYGFTSDVAICGAYAYMAETSKGLKILDVRNPTMPVLAATLPGDFQFVTSFGQRVLSVPSGILEVTNPSRPTILATLSDYGYSRAAVAGNIAYLHGDGQVRAIDVSEPAAPRLLAQATATDWRTGLAAAGTHLFLASGWSGLEVLELYQTNEFRKVGVYYPDACVEDVAVDWGLGLAYLTVSENPGLEVVNISDLRRLSPVSAISLPAVARVGSMQGSYLCVTGEGLQVVDLGDPARPVSVGQHQLGTGTSGLQVSGDLAYVAAGEYGLAIYRVRPQLVLYPPVRDGDQVRLTWLGGPGIRLQRAAGTAHAVWEDVPDSEGACSAALPISGAASFFRLIKR